MEGNRLVFVTLSPVEDYGRSPKLGVGQVALRRPQSLALHGEQENDSHVPKETQKEPDNTGHGKTDHGAELRPL